MLRAWRTSHPADKLGAAAFEETIEIAQGLPLLGHHHHGHDHHRRAKDGGAAPPPPTARERWMTLPGLFAAGGVDVMTTALLGALPPPPKKARVLDFCCGSGVISAALLAAEPSIRLYGLDADALAIRAAARNLPQARGLYLSDGWNELSRRRETRRAERRRGNSLDDAASAAAATTTTTSSSSSPASASSAAASCSPQQPPKCFDWIVSNPPCIWASRAIFPCCGL